MRNEASTAWTEQKWRGIRLEIMLVSLKLCKVITKELGLCPKGYGMPLRSLAFGKDPLAVMWRKDWRVSLDAECIWRSGEMMGWTSMLALEVKGKGWILPLMETKNPFRNGARTL